MLLECLTSKIQYETNQMHWWVNKVMHGEITYKQIYQWFEQLTSSHCFIGLLFHALATQKV